MEQRLTLVSDPTDEFPHNKNNSFKVHIPDGLRLEGTGWYVALLSLTLPNSDSNSDPFVTGHDTTVAKAFWQLLHFQGPSNKPLNILARFAYTMMIKENHVSDATNGVSYWNNVIQAMEQEVMTRPYNKKRQLKSVHDPNPVVYVKESMCPSFRWDGEDLIIKYRGADSTDGRQVNTVIYSYFDIAFEVARQWGFIHVKSDGKVITGPNLCMRLFLDEITSDHPKRELNLGLTGIKTLNGKALHAQRNLDLPRGLHVAASGSTVYDLMWYYTKGSEKWIRLSVGVEWHLTNLNATYDPIHRHTGKAVMVYTDLQQSTIVGNTKAHLLRQLVVRRGGESGRTYSEPTHLQWIPVSTRQTDIVEVQLADVDGKLLTLPKGKSLVTVALKQMV